MTHRGINRNKLALVLSLCFVFAGIGSSPAAAAEGAAPKTADACWFYTPPTDQCAYPDVGEGKVKNVILMIGDGMGLAEVCTARIRGVGPGGRLHMDRLPVTGMATTYSANAVVTDSAAAATALATGFKTNNGMVSLLPDGRRPVTILEAARDRQMATGLAVVCVPPHATPAAFASHAPDRGMYAEIFEQMLKSKVDVILGNGSVGTTTQPSQEAVGGRKMGYHVVATRQELRSATQTPLLGLLAIQEPTAEAPQPMLAEMTAKAIELLGQDPDGFFLMVEGSDIDWAGHSNDMAGSIRKTLLFDLAVKEAVEFARRDKHTLVVVTADHETGGMAITGGGVDGKDVQTGWVGGGHTGIAVPIFAYGPGARRFMGVHDNTEIPCLIAQLLGIKDFPKACSPKELSAAESRP